MSYYSQSRNQNRNYGSPESNKNRRYQGYNPFLDNAEQNKRHQETLRECERLKQEADARKRRQDAAVAKAMANNPYLNDQNLIQSFTYFSLEKDKAFEQQHSVKSASKTTADSHHSLSIDTANTADMGPDIISPQNLSNWIDADSTNNVQNNGSDYDKQFAKAQQNPSETKSAREEEDRIIINSDNPYHPTNFYKDKKEEQRKAVSLVNKYRVSPKDVIKADAVEHEYDQFMHSLEYIQDSHRNGYECNDSYDYHNGQNSGRKQNIGVDEMIPGQEMITPFNFSTLQKEDTVWIRNDDGDWEIFSVLNMEKTNCYNQQKRCYEETYVGTFTNQNREQTIWQEQITDEFRMARYIKEKAYAITEDVYTINNIFKVKMENGVNGLYVLKGYDKRNGIADLKCVKTGDRFQIDLSQVEHSIIGN